MTISITYYTPLDSLGDVSESDAVKFRAWAESYIKAKYPKADIEVTEENSLRTCSVSGASSGEEEDEIIDFVSRVFDHCDWDF